MRFDRNKSRIILVVSVLLLAVLMLSVFKYMSSHKTTKTTYELSEKFDMTNKDTLIRSTNDIRLFNGRNFVKYNPQSGETTKLLKNDTYSLTNVQEVLWSSDGQKVAIKSGPQSTDSYLGQILMKNQKDLGGKYWWSVDFDGDQVFHPVYENFVEVFWRNDELVGIPEVYEDEAETETSYALVAYKIPEGTKRNIVNLKPEEAEKITNVFDTTGSNFFYVNLTNGQYKLNMVDKDGNNKVLLYNNNNNIKMSPDGSMAVYFEYEKNGDIEESGNGRPGKIYYQQVNSSQPTILVKEAFEGSTFVISKDSNSVFVLEKQKKSDKTNVVFRHYSLKDSGVTNLITFSGRVDSDNLLSIVPVSNGGLALVSKNIVQFITKDPVSIKQNKTTIPAVKDSSKGFLLNQYKDGRVAVNIYQKPVDVIVNKVIEYIKNQGVNPDLIKIDFDTTNVE